MNSENKKHIRYIYDPQLVDPGIEELYPRSAFDFEQERWVAPICLLAKDAFWGMNSWNYGAGIWGPWF